MEVYRFFPFGGESLYIFLGSCNASRGAVSLCLTFGKGTARSRGDKPKQEHSAAERWVLVTALADVMEDRPRRGRGDARGLEPWAAAFRLTPG